MPQPFDSPSSFPYPKSVSASRWRRTPGIRDACRRRYLHSIGLSRSATSTQRTRWVSAALAVGFTLLVAAVEAQVPRLYGPRFNPYGAEEAPPTIFSADINDAEVDVFVLGSWPAEATAAAAVSVLPAAATMGSRLVFPAEMPGFEGVSLSSSPDITMSVWLMEKYFFEATVRDDVRRSELLMGYEGAEGTALQSLLVGNSRIGVSSFPYVALGDSGQALPAAAARFASEVGIHEFLVRIERDQPEEVLFRGYARVERSEVSARGFDAGTGFFLPDGAVTALRVWIESPNGVTASDGRTYAAVDTTSLAEVDTDKGYFRLSEAPQGRVLVHYVSNGREVGDPELGRAGLGAFVGGIPDPADPVDFAFGSTDVDELVLERAGAGYSVGDLEVEVAGYRALVVYEPGVFSPFAAANRYAAARQATDAAEVTAVELRVAGEVIASPEAAIDDVGALVIRPRGRSATRTEYRYPLSGFAPEVASVYSQPQETDDDVLPQARVTLSIETRQPVEQIALTPPIVRDSIQVVLNGIERRDIAVDPQSGAVDLPEDYGEGDELRIRYRTPSQTGGDTLLIGTGHRLSLGPRTALTFAAASRWGVVAQTAGVGGGVGQSPGAVTGSLGFTFAGTRLSIRTNHAVRAGTADTDGFLRVASMNGERIETTLLRASVGPSAVPLGGAAALPAAQLREPNSYEATLRLGGADYTFVAGERGVLVNRATDGESGLLPYADTVPPSESGAPPPEDEEQGSTTGPYPAARVPESDGVGSPVVVIEPRFPAGSRWVSVEIDLPGEGRLDAVTFRVRGINAGGLVGYIQLGRLLEDVDGDGRLDSGVDELSPGFAFDGPRASQTVGSTGTVVRSEDRDADGILDAEDPRRVAAAALPPLIDEWTEVTVPIPTAIYTRIGRPQSVRIVLVRDGDSFTSDAPDAAGDAVTDTLSDTSGDTIGETNVTQVIVADVTTHAAPPVVDVTGGVVANGVPRPTSTVRDTSGRSAEEAFPQVWGRLGQIDDSVLEVRYDNLSAVGEVVVAGTAPDTPAGRYAAAEAFVLFAAPGEVTFSLLGTGGVLKTGTLPVDTESTGEWLRLRITDETIGLYDSSGAERSVGAATGGTGTIRSWSVTFSAPEAGEPPAGGVFYIDEVALRETTVDFGAGGEAEVVVTTGGPLLSTDGGPLIGAPSLRLSGTYRTEGFYDSVTTPWEARAALTIPTKWGQASAAIEGAFDDGAADTVERTPVDIALSHSLALRPTDALTIRDSAYGGVVGPSTTATHGVSVEVSAGGVDAGASASLTLDGSQEEQIRRLDGRLRTESASLALGVTAVRTVESSGESGRTWWEVERRGYASIFSYLPGSVEGDGLSATLGLSILAAHLEPSVSLTAHARADTPEGYQDNGLQVVTRLPIRWTDRLENPHIVAVGYSREASERVPLSPTPTPSDRRPRDVLPGWSGFVAGRSPIVRSIPFAELPTAAPPATSIPIHLAGGESRYDARAIVEYSRGIPSTVFGLLIPAALRIEAGRLFVSNDGGTTYPRDLQAALSFAAANIWGNYGTSPRFNGYDSDEFGWAAAVTVGDTWTAEVSAAARFFRMGPVASIPIGSTEIEAATSFDATSLRASIDGALGWSQSAEALRRIPFLAEVIPETSRLRHHVSARQAIVVAGAPSTGVTGPVELTESNVTTQYRLDLEWSDPVRLSVAARIGWNMRSSPLGYVHTIGVAGAISFEARFR